MKGIDLLIECEDRTTLLCECKWSRNKASMEAVEEFRHKCGLFPNLEKNSLKPVLVAAGGVTDAVRREKDIWAVDLDDFWS